MPNWYRNYDDDSRTCEHCGATYSVDDWHTCQEGRDFSERSEREWERHYRGNGSRIKVLIAIDCLATEGCLMGALGDVRASLQHRVGEYRRDDDLPLDMGYDWAAKVMKK